MTTTKTLTLAEPGSPTRREQIAALGTLLAQIFGERALKEDRLGAFPHANLSDLHASGYLKLILPKAYGGDEVSLSEIVLAQEKLAQGDAGTALITAMQINVIGRLRDEKAWPEPVFAEIAKTLIAKGGTLNNCVSEAAMGSISRGGTPLSTATPVEGGYRINGTKIFVTGAEGLRFFITAVVLPPTRENPDGEVASAIVEAGSPGISIQPEWDAALAMRTCGNATVIYKDVFVPEHRLVERVAVGARRKPGANPWTLSVAAIYLGVAQAALEAAADYALTRVPTSLSGPIADKPHIKTLLGEMQASLIAARAVVHETARLYDEAPADRANLGPRLAAAKLLATNSACDVTDRALRVAGGFSLYSDLPFERYFRDARAGLFFPPQDDLALLALGDAALASRRSTSSEG